VDNVDPHKRRTSLGTQGIFARKLLLSVPILFLLIGVVSQATSQVVGAGATLVVRDVVSVRNSPPSQNAFGLVSDAGQEIATLHTGEVVRVVDSRAIKVLLATHVWIEVEAGGRRGWVFYGDDGQSNNFNQAR
jgi:hypothetical protein